MRLWFGVVCSIVAAAGVTVKGIPQHTRPQLEVRVNTVEQEVDEVQHVVDEVKQQEVDEMEHVTDEGKLKEMEQKVDQEELKVKQEQQKEEEEEELVAGTEEKSERGKSKQEKQRSTIRTRLIDEMQKTLVEEASREVAKVVGTLLLLMMMRSGGKGAMNVGRGIESCQMVLLHNGAHGDSFSSHLTQHLLR